MEGGGRRELLSQSTEGRHQKDYERNLNHKSDLSQLSSLSVSSLTLSDSHFMSNTAALAGPAVYMETKSDGTNTYIFATTGGNYACANLALESSSMCNGISGGEQCSSFANTCDDDDSDEKDLGINNDGDDEMPGVPVRDGGITGMSDDLRDGGTTGMSDDFGPETGPPPEDIAEALGDHTSTATGDFRDWATWSLPTSDPTRDPTPNPTPDPTHNPTLAPTFVPTATPTYNPTAEPTVQCNMDLVTRHSMILTELESISDATALRRTSTPQGKAVDWLVYVDSMYLCPGDNYLAQRYVLAVLYYATNGHQDWLTCSRSGDIASNDCPPTTKRFLSNYHECSWAGIGCNGSNFVTRIAFEENGLSGSIPSEIGALFSLKTLRMERGELSGSLPATLGDLTNLEKLDLDYNNLWGTLPSTFVHLENLQLIDLNNNDLSGSIDVLAGLSNLFFVQLQSNYFSGTVSEAFGSLSQLREYLCTFVCDLFKYFQLFLWLEFLDFHLTVFLMNFHRICSFCFNVCIEVFSVQQNQIDGGLALGFCNLRISGYLKYLEADCSSPADGGSVNCVCCTKCYPYDDSLLNNAESIGNGGGSIINTVPSLTTEAPSPKPTGRPTTEPTHNPTLEPTSEPSPFTNSPTEACNGINTSAWKESIINMLAASGVSTRSSLLTNGSPQAKAVWWILNRDPMRLCPGDERIEQRYLAALFYYSMDGPNWLDRGTGDQKFLGSASECYWMGLKCNPYGEITHIDIENNGLGGSLPYEIASFTKLEVLSLEKGEITGRIPTELGAMQELRELDLDFNMLTGELPYTLGNAPKLNVIDLNSNMLTGSISVLASVKEAYFVQLHNNKFSGDIAPSIGLLGNLQVLTLHKNDIAGVMPFMVCNRLAAYGGSIDHLWADCAGAVPKVSCSCCTKCFE